MITVELLQEMMAGKMLWISDGSYHHNAEIRGCSINKDNIILHTWQPIGSRDFTLPIEIFKKLMDGERVTYNRFTYGLYSWKFPFDTAS